MPTIIQSNKEFRPKKNTIIALDTETTGVDSWGKRVLYSSGKRLYTADSVFMVSMSDSEGNTWCCNWPVDPFTRQPEINQKDVVFILDTLSKKGVQLTCHNTKFDTRMMKNVDTRFNQIFKHLHSLEKLHDTLFMARICFTLELAYGLKYLSKKTLGISDEDEKELQKAVATARRKATMYNRRVEKAGGENPKGLGNFYRMMLIDSEELKTDYWLPYYFDENQTGDAFLCEKYCRFDTYRTVGLYQFYNEIMQNDKHLRDTYYLEMQKVWPIVDFMETRGITVFPDRAKEESKRCEEEVTLRYSNLQKIIREQNLKPFPIKEVPNIDADSLSRKRRNAKPKPEPEFNPGSPQQLLRVLYLPESEGGLGLETDRRNRKTGKLTTDKDTLRELMYSPFVRELTAFRDASHTKSLFFDKIEDMVKPYGYSNSNNDGSRSSINSTDNTICIIRPSFNQCGTKSGRLSAGGEGGLNVQQLSAGGKKSLGGSTYSSQKVFGCRKDHVWLGLDYSQQEARLFAGFAQVPVMLEAIRNKTDLFKAMANKAWGGVNNPQSIKAVIQALDLFREPANGEVSTAWQHLGWSKSKAKKCNPTDKYVQEVCEQFLSEFEYDIVKAESALGKEASRQRCKHITYAKIFGGGPGSYTHLLYCTLDEAKLFDSEYNNSMPELKRYIKQVEREARENGFIINAYGRKLRVDPNFAYRGVSYMIQGTAADMMKASLVKVHEFNQSIKARAYLILTIHDELKVEIHKSDLNRGYVKSVIARMENTEGSTVNVPMTVECTVSPQFWSVDEYKLHVWGKETNL